MSAEVKKNSKECFLCNSRNETEKFPAVVKIILQNTNDENFYDNVYVCLKHANMLIELDFLSTVRIFGTEDWYFRFDERGKTE